MTRPTPYTQRAIERAIRAALAAGLQVTGVRPDGTVLTEPRLPAEAADNRPRSAPSPLTGPGPLRDAREKLGV